MNIMIWATVLILAILSPARSYSAEETKPAVNKNTSNSEIDELILEDLESISDMTVTLISKK